MQFNLMYLSSVIFCFNFYFNFIMSLKSNQAFDHHLGEIDIKLS